MRTQRFERGSDHLNLYAVGMCSLCLIHCIVLPLTVTLFPIMGLISGDELVHKLLVLLAAPATIWLVYKASLGNRNLVFIVTALTGLALLLIAAFVEPLSRYETSLTVVGATVLGFSHLQRWLRLRQFRRTQAQVS